GPHRCGLRASGPRSQACTLFAAFVLVIVFTTLRAADWPMLGGRPDRNMVSSETGLPVEWDAEGRGNARIKWSADLGQTTFGSPVVSGGLVFIGTNNDD